MSVIICTNSLKLCQLAGMFAESFVEELVTLLEKLI